MADLPRDLRYAIASLRRTPAALARRRPPARADDSFGARRQPRPSRAAVPHREPGALGSRRLRGSRARVGADPAVAAGRSRAVPAPRSSGGGRRGAGVRCRGVRWLRRSSLDSSRRSPAFRPSWCARPGRRRRARRRHAALCARDRRQRNHRQRDPAGTLVTASWAPPRFAAAVMSGFAVLAMALAGIGLYGALTYHVPRSAAGSWECERRSARRAARSWGSSCGKACR